MRLTSRVLLAGVALLCVAVLLVSFALSMPQTGDSVLGRLVIEMMALQRELHRQLAAAMRLVSEHGIAAAWGLIATGFLYGVFHAAGPGHGKVVLSTYLATQDDGLWHGVILAVVSSFAQGVTAVLVVEVTMRLLGLPLRNAQDLALDLEAISYALIALIGLVLIYSNANRLRHRVLHGHDGHDHHHHHHGHGHSHHETPSARTFAGIVLSIGIRPCTGAILVLILGYALDLKAAGIAAVFAMSAGTAITVSVLAVLSVYARQASLRLVRAMPSGSARFGFVVDAIGLGGGLLVLALGLLLLHAALNTTRHPLL